MLQNSVQASCTSAEMSGAPALVSVGVVLAERIQGVVGANLHRMMVMSGAVHDFCENNGPCEDPRVEMSSCADLGLLPVCDVSGELLHLRMAADHSGHRA